MDWCVLTMASLTDFDYPDSAWNRAVDIMAHGDPFCCRTEWALSFHEAFAPGRDLCVVAAEGSLISFALHKRTKAGPLLEPVESSWLFGCPLLGPDAVPMLAQLLESHPKASVLLSGMDIEGPLLPVLAAAFGERYDLLHVATENTCRASLDRGLDGYLSRRSAKTRRGVRNAARRLHDRGVTFERHQPTTQAEADAVYARIIAVEDRSWKGLGECGMSEPQSLQFYSMMLRRMAVSGCGRVMLARHEGTDIGFIFGGLCGPAPEGNIYRGQQFSFADDWRAASLGNVLQLEQVRWLCDDGVARYDMGPVMEYKHHWTETQARLDAIALRPN
jgi:CelD/BcsL family acetyltransferase involved in cellulose biosynthesis